MDIYQPMMFVGLGGTGCMVGTELERRLREEFCGPDGRALISRLSGRGYLPYQLPACTQFVYADLNASELSRLRTAVVPSKEHEIAVSRTQRLTRDLVPRFNTYQRVAQSLRTNATDQVRDWLPPPSGEPHIAPLVRGAGQLPTVGRAALFETFRHGLAPAEEPLTDAIRAISNSGDELSELGGRLSNDCDVFVAFSVAGGTGAGIFYDYLCLVGDALYRQGYRAHIYPLVVMPSAFQEDKGGGRRAKLNAAPALLDLFRLIDAQNGASEDPELGLGPRGDGIRYPGRGQALILDPLTIQTAFLFSGSAAIDRDDLHRSVSSFVLSLVSTGTDTGGEVGERLNMSFAEDFINHGVVRGTRAESGIGLRGVSTSLVAAMSVPVDDLADIIAHRLLGRAFRELNQPTRDNAEGNEHLIDAFLGAANLEELRTSRPLPFDEAEPARGADAISHELSARSQTLENKVMALEERLRRQMPVLVGRFDPWRAVQSLLGEIDIFRLYRVLAGSRYIDDEIDRGGVVADLESRQQEPIRPAGITVGPPALAHLRDRRFGMGKMRWADGPVQNLIADQDAWYEWRTRSAWQAAWAESASQWRQALEATVGQVATVVNAFDEHARDEQDAFEARRAELYRPRAGVTYLLPSQRDLDAFYQATLDRLVRQLASNARATEGDVVLWLIGPDGWRRVWEAAQRDGMKAAVSVARERLKEAVKGLFTDTSARGANPLLPSMASLLANAAGRGPGNAQLPEVRQFEAKIHGLIPQGFTPQGSGNLRVLISYPAKAKDPTIERFLRDRMRLPAETNMSADFRAVAAEAITVTQLRTSMSINEVPEVREVLRHWSDAVGNEQREDFLRWRQRLGYDFTWLATTEADRVRILHHFLCAAWNGQITTSGGAKSPSRLVVTLGPDRHMSSMTLPLQPLQAMSSWASLPRAYEQWVFEDDDDNRRDFCGHLMRMVPTDILGTPRRPAALFEELFRLAGTEKALIGKLEGPNGRAQWAGESDQFWTRTMPAALDMRFETARRPARDSLRQLYQMFNPHERASTDLAGGEGYDPQDLGA
ncbi:tubulin-like doman-containing protein [Frankia sp. AgB1.9]|uniref:tubulin-like doman-containing protein n=1 Tax=unclassified Frankia TaxID=2632575 RepID=UPI001931EB43|nr:MULTISPECIES: tubulin-like doman-containing protein [unclassified Frankia]MBL7492348.1 tubulin-like doman-containing protein [Frankia sp. AgW1.1]MBL7546997.1 tubulin-like doman-containing protein [Frankia sp. AgB1.9]MBL7622286.1 tubulin-like doman-containing protein [Frankia sp. AgB1.8]